MTLFLTSHCGGYFRKGEQRLPAELNHTNGFLDELKKRWVNGSRLLLMAASETDFKTNDSILQVFAQAFPMSGLSVSSASVCDGRNPELVRSLGDYDVIILSGGHVPTQNLFFRAIDLRRYIRDFRGIVIGISAGTMNCADTVYAHPELDGEAVDPNYSRYLQGLGLTEYMILPHYQKIKNDILDGLRVFEDIAYPDSLGKSFYALCDGSYILQEGDHTQLRGEAFKIADGILRQISSHNDIVDLKNE